MELREDKNTKLIFSSAPIIEIECSVHIDPKNVFTLHKTLPFALETVDKITATVLYPRSQATF